MSIQYNPEDNVAFDGSDGLTSAYSVAAAQQANLPNRPLSVPPPPKSLKKLNPRLWSQQDIDGIALMESLRWQFGKESYDSNVFEWDGVGRPFKRNHILRKANHGGNNPLQEQ